jgi:signal transduction histidine kinase/ActR/RegA family two-component response regulator
METTSDNSRSRPSLATTFLVAMVAVAVVAVGIMGYSWISREYANFERESGVLRAQFERHQRDLIRKEVERVVASVEYYRSQTRSSLELNLRGRVEDALDVAHHLHQTYSGSMERPDLERLILETLRPIRFNDGRGYLFVVTLEGVERLYPVHPELEGTSLIDLQDDRGAFVIRNEIAMVREFGEGFVEDHWRKPGSDDQMAYPKLTFVKAFEPFDWYIGTGEYVDELEAQVKDALIRRIATIRFGTEGYIFINTYAGDAILSDGQRVQQPRNLWDLTDPNGVKVIQEERRAVENPDGAFIRYTWSRLSRPEPAPKVSFIKGVPDWEWMVGAGVYLDEVDALIAAQRNSLQRDVRRQVGRIALIMASLIVLILVAARAFSVQIERNTRAFLRFFAAASSGSADVATRGLRFAEFTALADAANTMIRQRTDAEDRAARLQEQLARSRKMEALGLLTGGVAHDLNNILSGVVSYPDLLLARMDPDDPLRRPIEVMRDSGARAAAVVSDLLDATRGGNLKSEVCDLNEAVRDFLSSPISQDLAARWPGVELVSVLSEQTPPVRCTPSQLQKALMNLVMNGAEAIGDRGSVTVSTSILSLTTPSARYEEIPPGDYATLVVADTGHGIDASDLSRIFDPFFTKKTLGRSGSGLGLAVVWHTVHGHGGFIDVTSGGDGTVFTLVFPAVVDELPGPTGPTSVAPDRGDGQTVLVVDDEPDQRLIAEEILDELGYRVVTAASGEEALEHLDRDPPDLVVLDMLLGQGLSGLQTYRRMVARRPGQRAIIASGFAETDDVRSTQALGAGRLVSKPYSLADLAAAVAEELRRGS